jgi:hypothetical protein
MTLKQAMEVLMAVDHIASAHGVECRPLISRRVLYFEFWRGGRVAGTTLTEDSLNACPDATAVQELVERLVAGVLRVLGAAVA